MGLPRVSYGSGVEFKAGVIRNQFVEGVGRGQITEGYEVMC